MAISTPYIINASFEEGLSGWVVSFGDGTISTHALTTSPTEVSSGATAIKFSRTGGGLQDNQRAEVNVQQSRKLPVYGGQTFSVSCDLKVGGATSNLGGSVHVYFYNEDRTQLEIQQGNHVMVTSGSTYRTSTANVTAPEWARHCEIGGSAYLVPDGTWACLDNFRTTYSYTRGAILTYPTSGTTVQVGNPVFMNVTISGTGAPVTAVDYYYTNEVDPPVHITQLTDAPFGHNATDIPEGEWLVYAVVTFADLTQADTNRASIVVGEEPGIAKEFRASNAYAYLVAENFVGISDSIPATAMVLGAQLEVDYGLTVISRTKDLETTEVGNSNILTAFDLVDGGVFEAVLLRKIGDGYEQVGTPMLKEVPIVAADFTIEEEGTSEDKKWTVFTKEGWNTTTIGGESALWGQDMVQANDFTRMAVGIRFYPSLLPKPEYADSGDAVYRVRINRLRLAVYFDAGSVEYYFADGAKTQIIKGTLAAYYTLEGNLRTGDASGVLQLTPDLDTSQAMQQYIGDGWTIHAAYPPTDANQIGDVSVAPNGLGMIYTGLPTQLTTKEARSRYEFISENFYGDPDYRSIYGVNGVDRAFAYNKSFFYKIYTQSDPEKDAPHHVANHHSHLALGYHGGRVDISVAGEPYNFNGVDGASSWAFGDKVVGLLPLSGTILGVFGSKSIWGIAGTTVDNFATQVISPNIGAIEYTITDMGFPVYANAYGIYTLSQTQQYGDYLGQPMSKDLSPWLRPRLLRKPTSDKEVVCAFPVRSKNQYRLCFSDGYVSTMTLNGQQTPTFSFQKYFYPTNVEIEAPYDYKSIVPAAVSSELDDGGEERIHLAPYTSNEEAPPATGQLYFEFGNAYSSGG